MTKHRGVFLVLLVLVSTLALSKAQAAPDICRLVLSTYLDKVRSGDGKSWSPEMEKLLDEAREAQGIDPVPFSNVAALIPLFNSGIVHRVIAQELNARGHTSAQDMHDVLVTLNHLTSDKQIEFVDAIVMRLLYGLKDISIDGDNFRQMRDDAASYHMDLEAYLRFVRAWTTQRSSNYLTIKLAILDNLLQSSQPMNEPVMEYGSTKWSLFKRKLAREKPLLMPPPRKNVSFAALVLGEDEAYSGLEAFLTDAPSLGAMVFIETHFRDFSRPQLQALIANHSVFSTLEPKIRQEILERETQFAELLQGHSQILENLKLVDEQISALQKREMSTPTLSEATLKRLQSNLAKYLEWSPENRQVVMEQISTEAPNMSSQEYLDLALQALGISYRLEDGKALWLVGRLQEISFNFSLNAGQAKKIQDALVSRLQSFTVGKEKESFFKFTEVPWGRYAGTPVEAPKVVDTSKDDSELLRLQGERQHLAENLMEAKLKIVEQGSAAP